MIQRNHFFLVADMYLGAPDPLDQEGIDEECRQEALAYSFDVGLDKTAEFEKIETNATLHWNDQLHQLKSSNPWLTFRG